MIPDEEFDQLDFEIYRADDEDEEATENEPLSVRSLSAEDG